MRRGTGLIVGGWVALGLGGFAVAQPVLETRLDEPQQVIEGWGSSLVHYDAENRALYEGEAFRRAYRDLGLNILRMDMQKEVLVTSPTDFATPIRLGPDLAGNVAAMDFDIAGVETYGKLAKWLSVHALEPERVRMTGSLWTPPHWMKGPTGKTAKFADSGQVPTPFLSGEYVSWNPKPISNGDSVGGRLLTTADNLQQYGRYVAAWVEGFEQAYGVPLHAISLQNESSYENNFNSMVLMRDEDGNRDYNQYAIALDAVRDAWEQHGLDTKVMGPHVGSFAQNPGNPYNLDVTHRMIAGVKQFDDDLIDFLDYYNANFYNPPDEGAVKNVAGFWRGGKQVAPGEWAHWHTPPGVAGDGKAMWYSETSGEGTDWNGAMTVAVKMHNALVHGQGSAYVYWQLLSTKDEADKNSLLGANDLDDPEQSGKYAAFKHYSRYIRPGAVRLETGFEDTGLASLGTTEATGPYDTAHSLNTSAFYHPGDGRLTYVLTHMLDDEQTLTIELPEGMSLEAIQAFRSSATERFEPLGAIEVVDGRLTYTAPGRSITTLTAVIPEPTAGVVLLGGWAMIVSRHRS